MSDCEHQAMHCACQISEIEDEFLEQVAARDLQIEMARNGLAELDIKIATLKAVAKALLDALPRCLDPGCSEPAVYGVLSHEPEKCVLHAAEPGAKVHSKRADWADEAEELRKAVET